MAVRDAARLREYGRYRRTLHAAGVEVRWGQIVVRADGVDAVESVTLAPCDAAWRPDLDRAYAVAADALCTAYGFVPTVELARLLGCALTAEGSVRCDDDMRTSVPHVFAAGEPTGIGGAELATAEGAIAGAAAAGHARRGSGAPADAGLVRRRRRHARFAALLGDLFAPRPGLWELAAPDTVVCRCEDVTLAQARAAGASSAAGGMGALKIVSRCGQGPCQGRMCAELVARAAGQGAEHARYSVRPPLRPIALGTLDAHPAFMTGPDAAVEPARLAAGTVAERAPAVREQQRGDGLPGSGGEPFAVDPDARLGHSAATSANRSGENQSSDRPGGGTPACHAATSSPVAGPRPIPAPSCPVATHTFSASANGPITGR